jgi:hypothetical protein
MDTLHDSLPATAPLGTHCLFVRRNGKQCARAAVDGGELCTIHGGSLAMAAEQVKRQLLAMTEASLEAIEETLTCADPKLRADVAFRLLAIAGYGPSSTIKIEELPDDLASLTAEQLAARADKTTQRLRMLAMTSDATRDRSLH